MIKKILFLIFLISYFLFLLPASAGNYLTVTSPPGNFFVKDKIIIPIKITNTPANAIKINFYITDQQGIFDPVAGLPFLKTSFAPPPVDQEATYSYTWDTSEAGSNVGNHYFIAYLFDASEKVLDQDTQAFTLLGTTDNPNNVDNNNTTNNGTINNGTTNNGTTNTTPPIITAGKAFDLGKLGTVSFLPTKVNSLSDLVTVIINWLLGLAGALAVVAIIYSGIMYMMAGGDTEKAVTARKNLLWAIIGLIILFLSYVILGLVSQLLFTSP